MRLRIKTDGVPAPGGRPGQAQAGLQGQGPAGHHAGRRPIWVVRLDAFDTTARHKESIWVEVAGDKPKLTVDDYAVVRGLVFAPWVGRDGKIVRDFRAEAIEPASPPSPSMRPERPGQPRTIPYPRSDQGDPMTSIHTYDPTTAARHCPSCRRCRSARWRSASPTCSRTRPTCRSPGTSPCSRPSRSACSSPRPGQHAGHHPVGAPVRRRRHHQPAPGRGRPETWSPRGSATTASPSRPTPTSPPNRPATSRPGEP